MRLGTRQLAVATILAACAAVGLAACDRGQRETAPVGAAWKDTRERVLEGARQDFEVAVEGPEGFETCFISRFSRELTRKRLVRLAGVHATEGEPAAARALNGLGVPVGDACGGRRWVPQLTEAATGLRAAALSP